MLHCCGIFGKTHLHIIILVVLAARYTHITNAWQTWEGRSAASSPAPLHTDPTEPGQQAELLPDGIGHSKSKNATSSGWQLPGIHHHSAHNPVLHSEFLPPQPHTLVPSVHPWILSHQTGGMTAGKSVRIKKFTETILWFVDCASRYICVMKTNLMYYLSLVYFVNQPLHVLGMSIPTQPTHSQLKSTTRTNCCIYTAYLLMTGYRYAQNMQRLTDEINRG